MSAGNPLGYHVLVSGLLPAVGAPLPDGTRPRWSPLSHTLIHGPAEAALVDPPITVAQATALANWIEAFGKRLAYIYITHWHADHWLATSELAKRFPGVTVYASAATIDRMTKGTPGGVPAELWTGLFPGQLPEVPIPILAQPVPADGFAVDGRGSHEAVAGDGDRFVEAGAAVLNCIGHRVEHGVVRQHAVGPSAAEVHGVAERPPRADDAAVQVQAGGGPPAGTVEARRVDPPREARDAGIDDHSRPHRNCAVGPGLDDAPGRLVAEDEGEGPDGGQGG